MASVTFDALYGRPEPPKPPDERCGKCGLVLCSCPETPTAQNEEAQ